MTHTGYDFFRSTRQRYPHLILIPDALPYGTAWKPSFRGLTYQMVAHEVALWMQGIFLSRQFVGELGYIPTIAKFAIPISSEFDTVRISQ